jgi:uncharacterized surface protein with fasciclin (FAS1) repeats
MMPLKKIMHTGLLLLFSVVTKAQAADVFEVIVNSADHSKFVKSLNVSSLVNTLKTGSELTVFAPNNNAFSKISKSKMDSLLLPQSKDILSGIIGFHIVSGRFDTAKLIDNMKRNGGEMQLLTITGRKLTVLLEGEIIKVSDGTKAVGAVTTPDLKANNGVVHVIDAVVLPQ